MQYIKDTTAHFGGADYRNGDEKNVNMYWLPSYAILLLCKVKPETVAVKKFYSRHNTQ